MGLDIGGRGGSYDRISGDLGMPWVDGTKDTDGDGLSDDAEREGWRTRDDGVFVTDPTIPDSDGDGLTDGQEAGPLASGTQSTKVYVALRLAKVGGGDEALVTIACLTAGALASRISQKEAGVSGEDKVEVHNDSVDDEFAVIGRAATKTIIAEAMRQMGGSHGPPDEPKQ